MTSPHSSLTNPTTFPAWLKLPMTNKNKDDVTHFIVIGKLLSAISLYTVKHIWYTLDNTLDTHYTTCLTYTIKHNCINNTTQLLYTTQHIGMDCTNACYTIYTMLAINYTISLLYTLQHACYILYNMLAIYYTTLLLYNMQSSCYNLYNILAIHHTTCLLCSGQHPCYIPTV